MKRKITRIGETFGEWTIQEFSHTVKHPSWTGRHWACKCSCGTERTIEWRELRRGKTTSCGCTRSTHGMYNTPIYGIWKGIKSRCNDKANPHYGKCGITVCDRWEDSFENFYKDMGDRPSDKHSIDREDNDAGYSPTNCRWTTLDVQANSKSTNLPITYNGIWAKKLNIHRKTLQWRLLHWPTDRCFTPKIP